MMIGRKLDVREIAATLAGSASVVLAGPRRTGKTSVCDAVLGRLSRQGLYTVAVDLFTPNHRALHQFGGFYDLRPIDESAWSEGLAERFHADDCTIAEEALARMIEYGEGHPRTTMLVAQ
jgi:hypothetical protein